MRLPLLVLPLFFAPLLWGAPWVEPHYQQSISDREIESTLQTLRTTELQKQLQQGVPLPPDASIPLLPPRIDNSATKHSRPVFS